MKQNVFEQNLEKYDDPEMYDHWDENELHADSISMVHVCRVKTE